MRIERMTLADALATLCTAGTAAAQECFIGEMRMFAGNFAPRNWALAQSQLLSIEQNAALFSIIGVTCGGGGQTAFALPDMRGRTAVGVGQGPGLPPLREGQAFGASSVTLGTQNLPQHSHDATTEVTVNAVSAEGTTSSPANNLPSDDGSDRISFNATPDVTLAPPPPRQRSRPSAADSPSTSRSPRWRSTTSSAFKASSRRAADCSAQGA